MWRDLLWSPSRERCLARYIWPACRKWFVHFEAGVVLPDEGYLQTQCFATSKRCPLNSETQNTSLDYPVFLRFVSALERMLQSIVAKYWSKGKSTLWKFIAPATCAWYVQNITFSWLPMVALFYASGRTVFYSNHWWFNSKAWSKSLNCCKFKQSAEF